MGKIYKLPEDIVSKIAAGEVIERPAFVVKELIENALDAGATEIEIEIENAGLEKIEVVDNGSGMSRKDLEIATLPHTTSKIRSIEDLHTIHTLGFRGEALASISSVSTLVIESKSASEKSGHRITIKDQRVVDLVPIGKSDGTRVTVLNLFSNIPARKKFLKHPLTEMRLITEMVSHYLLSNPTVSFRLSHNSRVIIDVTSVQLQDRLHHVWGEEFVANTIAVTGESSYIQIEGLVGKPQMNASSTSKLWIYINKRKVTDALIHTAVREAFGTLLMARSHPTGILFLTVPPEIVDVNVHPTKREVRFVTPSQIFQEVKDAVLTALSHNNLTYSHMNGTGPTLSLQKDLRDIVSKTDIAAIGVTTNEEILQVHKSFLVTETAAGLMIIDQHAAHESLLFFEFLKAWEDKKTITKTVTLTEPALIEFTTPEELIFEEHQNTLSKLGFEINPFGSKTYQVTAIPELYQSDDLRHTIKELLETLTKDTKEKLTEKEHHMLATLACKSAIKAGETLTPGTMKDLVGKLTERHYAYTCPHGRPVKIEITLTNLTRMFKR